MKHKLIPTSFIIASLFSSITSAQQLLPTAELVSSGAAIANSQSLGVATNSLNAVPTEAPLGSIDALQKLVVEGSQVDVDWKISYPVYNFNETDTEVTVKFLTVAVGPNKKIRFGTRVPGGEYEEFYNDYSEEDSRFTMEPGTVVSKTLLAAHNNIEFLVRHPGSKIPGKWVSTENADLQHMFIELKDGDAVPDVAPVSGQRSVANILAPYSENGIVKIGANQKILLFEVYTSDVDHFGFDLQDLVLLISYEQISIEK